MSMADYQEENYKSNSKVTGGIYFYYRLDDKIYLVRTEDFENWKTKELTAGAVGIPANAKIKYIRISGAFGYIFYLDQEGKGNILKTTSSGEYWTKIALPSELNDSCTLKFLNQSGMTVDGYLTIPSADGSKCDLYAIDDFSEETLKKIDVSALIGENSSEYDYYHMPTEFFTSVTSPQYGHLLLEVGKDKDDADTQRFITPTSSNNWITERQYYQDEADKQDSEDVIISNFNNSVDALDEKYFVKDPENYSVDSVEIKISESKAKEIAEQGFKESASRIAGEGIDDTAEENIRIDEVYPNNYFTRKYREYDDIYNTHKRKCYVVTKANDMGNGVSVYVDVTTGLIIGGYAFGD